jgi:SpoVK/Ycf46/Vps4 family AAA+-type ATPase
LTQLETRPRTPNRSTDSLEERRRALFREGSPYAPAYRSDIVGVEEVLERVDDVLHVLVHAERYAQAGSRLEPGVLLTGPPGTGKTLAARYLATASDALFVDVRAFPAQDRSLEPEDVSALFRLAREARREQGRPVVLFWDEIDAVCSASGPWGCRATDVCSQLIAELDGVSGKAEGVLLVACTNEPNALPPALRRRGRIGITIPFQAPDREGKALLLAHYASHYEREQGIDYLRIASLLDPAAPASALEEIAGQAWREAVRRSIDEDAEPALTEGDLRRAALDDVFGARAYPRRSEKSLLRTAVHEIGHALLALRHGIPVRLVSCRQGASFLGVTSTGEGSDGPETIAEGLARLRIGLAGMLAEVEAGLGQGGGAQRDVFAATRVASDLVSYGVGKSGLIFEPHALGGSGGPSRSLPAVSEWLLAQVDADAAALLAEAASDVRAYLAEVGGETLLELGRLLVERETLDGRELEEAICGLAAASLVGLDPSGTGEMLGVT